jgi:hypothetical protein
VARQGPAGVCGAAGEGGCCGGGIRQRVEDERQRRFSALTHPTQTLCACSFLSAPIYVLQPVCRVEANAFVNPFFLSTPPQHTTEESMKNTCFFWKAKLCDKVVHPSPKWNEESTRLDKLV